MSLFPYMWLHLRLIWWETGKRREAVAIIHVRWNQLKVSSATSTEHLPGTPSALTICRSLWSRQQILPTTPWNNPDSRRAGFPTPSSLKILYLSQGVLWFNIVLMLSTQSSCLNLQIKGSSDWLHLTKCQSGPLVFLIQYLTLGVPRSSPPQLQ